MKNHGVKVSTLNPGATRTEFLAVSGQKINWYQELALMNSYPVCEYGINKMFKGAPSTVPGFFNQLSVILVKFLPRSIQTKAAAILMKS